MTKMNKILIYLTLVIGCAILISSILIENVTIMIIGLLLLILSIIFAFIADVKTFESYRLTQTERYNEIIDLIKNNQLKDATNLINKEIKNEKDKSFLRGLVYGKKLNSDEFDQLKIIR